MAVGMTTRRGRRARAGAAAVVACALALGLAACGDDDAGVARADGGGTTTAAGADTTAAASPQDAALRFARCMRGEGVDFPDPEPDSGGRVRFRAPAAGADPADPATREAFEACQGELAGALPELSEDDRTALRDAQLAYARCMRENGVDVPDPEPGGPGIIRVQPGDDPDFESADETCRPRMQEVMDRLQEEG